MTAQESASGFAQVNGAELNYETQGEGYPLLLIHGGLADHRMWDDQMAAFAQHFRVIRYDMRGFGRSAMPAGVFSYHEDAYALLQALGIDRAAVLGLSFGGAIAIDLTLAHPESVTSLVLVASALGGYEFGEDTMLKIDEADAAFDAGDVARAVELENRIWIDGPFRRPEEVDPLVRSRVAEMNASNYALPSDAGTLDPPSVPAVERLQEIHVPTLVLTGELDVPDIGEIGTLLAERIPHATRQVIPGTAHHPNMEKPERFNATVLEFLSNTRAENTAHANAGKQRPSMR